MKGNDIKTSVIIPVYNVKDYLTACVESVLSQTQREKEIILVDDGSTDGSDQIIQYYEEHYPFVKAIYQENQKLGAARNAGLQIASGQYIYFLDADDHITDDLLEKCYQIAKARDLDFVMFDAVTVIDGEETDFREGSSVETFDRSGLGIKEKTYSGIEYWNAFFARCGVFSSAGLFYINTDFLKKNRLYFEPGIFYEDMDWMVRMYSCAKKITYIAQRFYYRRIRKESIMTTRYNDMHMQSCVFVCRKLIQMSLEENNTSKQKLILSTFRLMTGRLKEIIKSYCEEERLDTIQDEVLRICRYMRCVYEDIGQKDINYQVEILLTIEALYKFFQASGSKLKMLDLKLENYKWRLVEEEMRKIPLDKTDQVIGIYGTGVICERFISLYRKYIGGLSDSVFFIDTYKESKGDQQGYPLYNIRDLAGICVDCILVASTRYKDEMIENIQRYCFTEPTIFFVPELINVLFKDF